MTIPVNESLRRPMGKIALIQHSPRCFGRGLLGLLPIIGLPFAVAALVSFVRVAFNRGSEWNPAERYLSWGVACAVLGLLLTLAAFAALVATILSAAD